jgi:hypothetical protein
MAQKSWRGLSGGEAAMGQEVQEGEGEAQGKPTVTALALISWLQSSWRGPTRVCALLTQANKTFLS